MSGTRFSIPIAALAQKMRGDLEATARKATFDVFSAVVQRAPVATGRFRSNFNVSYGAPNLTYDDSTNQARSAQEVAKALTMPIGGVTYISNGLPYAYRLEHGWSKQAPSGMVRLAAQEFQDFVAKATAK